MALVLALMAISFLVAITVQLASSVNFQMQGANNIGNSIQLDAINRSGLNLIRAALAVDFEDNKHDSIHDSWGKLGGEDAPTIVMPRLFLTTLNYLMTLSLQQQATTSLDTKSKRRLPIDLVKAATIT